jgi:septal ring factor EnvC (AmiA/AmiB activator)
MGLTLAEYSTQITIGILVAITAFPYIYSQIRKALSTSDKEVKRDKGETDFLKSILDEYEKMQARLSIAEKEKADNAQKIGQLTAEVQMLKTNVSEVKELLKLVSVKLDESNAEIHKLNQANLQKEGELLRTSIEKSSISEKLAECKAQLSKCKLCDGVCING